MNSAAKVALRCSHQFSSAYSERHGNFQYERKRGHVLPALNLAHVRARDACSRCKLVLSDALSDARSAHGLPKG